MTSSEKKSQSRLSDLIKDARIAAANTRSAPAVADFLLSDCWSELTEDDGVHRMLLRAGLNAFIRKAIKGFVGDNNEGAPGLRLQQLEMWPVPMRVAVAAINREAVFVPSRDEFVELVPDAISTAELREAGHYLIGHGEDSVRRGQTVLRLADLRDLEEGRAA